MKPSRSKLLVSSLKRSKTAHNIVNQGKLILFNDDEAITYTICVYNKIYQRDILMKIVADI